MSETRPSETIDGLAALVEASRGLEHGKVGFHHGHQAAAERLPAIAERFLAAGYILEMITCQDRRQDLQKMRMVYTFSRLVAGAEAARGVDRHLVHADLDPGAAAPTLCPVYRAADWFEREVYDMYGVRFDGHPNLERLLLPEDADFHALLKDFGRMEDAAGSEGGGSGGEPP